MPEQKKQARVFISHSSQDKPFVRKLISDLETRDLDVWFDEKSLKPGDSIVAGVSEGLKDTDYLVIVLSQSSVASDWVQAELSSALMDQFSNRGISVIPIKIDDCEIPFPLRDRVYADFRTDYNKGLNALLSVLQQESETAETAAKIPPLTVLHQNSDDGGAELSKMKLADLRRLMAQKLTRTNISSIWFDTFSTRMDDDLLGRNKGDCVIELLIRAKESDLLPDLIHNLCAEAPNLVNPR